ncbi:hypothetical protein BX285_6723 [Streptomyces sp. 1114.5]|uniref:hypothetical protein n=1 Tax=unclassified Streptomyces TaxID=2593676 RepID=UPI000BD49B19|nr:MULTISPECIES: hypothetical protein [unclassified Streptomyces]RKT09627.1 hypothetical protein BX285_6723 [Streptomyces sp. 1114.5]SOB89054.1 hypothetical protein SAMN06272789_7386 [Streptomyces sp. 1331.2]
MAEPTSSVLDVLTASMGALPVFDIAYFLPCGTVKDRVLKHDLLHVLLIDRAWPVTFRFEDEYCAAVVQAVLMRDSRVSARSVTPNGRPPAATVTATAPVPASVPSLDEIREVTVPSVVDFLRFVLVRLGLRVPDDFRLPDGDFVSAHYRLGLRFADEFRTEFGEDYASVPADVLKDLPFADVARSFRRAAGAAR